MIDNPDVKKITDAFEIAYPLDMGWETFARYTVDEFIEIIKGKSIVRINRREQDKTYIFFAFDPQNGVAIITYVPKQIEG